jgi:hypothetical protein
MAWPCRMLVGMKGRDHFVVFDEDGRILLEWILKKQVMRNGTEFVSFRIWTDVNLLSTLF